ncbi:MAG TPA: type II toxin-antitoxin system RelE/ParE family toxin [Verrucomicrobiae bacterium]|nr:type II toxin-antitoxin system RelE/ParE family toxin [Verrucomicrobiae bacterium]
MRFEFHPEALSEYQDAAHYYANRQAGLERRFMDCVEIAIRRTVANPERWRKFDGDVRRCLTQVFPYAVLFSVETDYILIIAVMHCRREPAYWKNRLKDK